MAKGTFGERLKRERELREVKLEEVSAATRISERFLQALENEDWSRLPGGVFGRGFVRTVARYLGLDEENLLAEYDLARSDSAAVSARPEERIPSPPKWIPVLLALGVLVLLAAVFYGGVYAWRRFAAHRAAKHSSFSLPPSAPPSDQKPSYESSYPLGLSASRLDLSVAASSFTHVRVLADNALLFEGNLAAGETRHFAASETFELSASNSSSVLLELNGLAMPPLGEPGASGTIVLSRKDLEPASGGNSQP